MCIKTEKLFYNISNNGFQTSNGVDYIALDNNCKYYPRRAQLEYPYLLISNQKVSIELLNSELIEIYTIKDGDNIKKVAIFGGSDGELQQV